MKIRKKWNFTAETQNDIAFVIARKVFDYDWGLQDDFMGAAFLDLTQLELGHSQDVTLELKDPGRPKQHLGEIYLSATLWPRNQQEKEQVTYKTKQKKSFSLLLIRINSFAVHILFFASL